MENPTRGVICTATIDETLLFICLDVAEIV